MLDIKFVRENPDVVKENIKERSSKDQKLPLVDRGAGAGQPEPRRHR